MPRLRISKQTNVMTFKNRDNLEYDVVITEMPTIPAPIERGEDIVVPGRDGGLWRSDKSWEQIKFPVRFWVPPAEYELRTVRQNVNRWLSGAGKLRFQDSVYWDIKTGERPYYYKARVRDLTLTPRPFHDGFDGVVTFVCDPYMYIEADEIQFFTNESGQYIVNSFGNDSLPIITVHCQGPFDIAIGDRGLSLEGSYDITGAVVIDCEKQLIYRRATGLSLLQYATGEFPVLRGTYAGGGGRNRITWSGSIPTVTWNTVIVDPNWRIMDAEATWEQVIEDGGAGTMGDEGAGI